MKYNQSNIKRQATNTDRNPIQLTFKNGTPLVLQQLSGKGQLQGQKLENFIPK